MTTRLITEFYGENREAVISFLNKQNEEGHLYEVILAEDGEIIGKHTFDRYSLASMLGRNWATKENLQMELNEYQQLAMKTAIFPKNESLDRKSVV